MMGGERGFSVSRPQVGKAEEAFLFEFLQNSDTAVMNWEAP
jgi:hypothetical protein